MRLIRNWTKTIDKYSKCWNLTNNTISRCAEMECLLPITIWLEGIWNPFKTCTEHRAGGTRSDKSLLTTQTCSIAIFAKLFWLDHCFWYWKIDCDYIWKMWKSNKYAWTIRTRVQDSPFHSGARQNAADQFTRHAFLACKWYFHTFHAVTEWTNLPWLTTILYTCSETRKWLCTLLSTLFVSQHRKISINARECDELDRCSACYLAARAEAGG